MRGPAISRSSSRYVLRADQRACHLLSSAQIEQWAIGDVAQPREGVVSMEECVKSFR